MTSQILKKVGFESYLVGGCVRDILLERAPKDWDLTTNAKPDEIASLFPETYQNNDFGTVGVVTTSEDPSVKVIEITPYRTESGYTDARRPDTVSFDASLEDDLKRRDFTINAFAYDIENNTLIDRFEGEKDLADKRIRAVGDPKERFGEDALRMMRAIRIAVELSFSIEGDTMTAISENANNLSRISKERIHDEFVRILNSNEPMQGIILLEKLGLLEHIAPELLEAKGIEQNKTHAYDVYEHLLRSLQHAADKEWTFEIRLAALLHDIGKPASRRWSDEKKDWTFHGHEVIGAKIAKKFLERLKFSRETSDKVLKLIRWHMFFSDPEAITLSAVRRTIRNVGTENIWDLLNLRICDRIGTGRPKEQPFRFRQYKAMVEEAQRDPISVKMLKIKGEELMEVAGEKAGPRIGYVLHALLEEVLEDPSKNTPEYLKQRALELFKLEETELKTLGEKGKDKKEEEEAEERKEIRKKHYVEPKTGTNLKIKHKESN